MTNNDIATAAAPFLQRIEEIDDELESEKAAHMAACRTLRSRRKDVFGDAKSAGIAVKPLKAVVKRRKLERSIEALPTDFDLDDSAQYSALAAAFAGTPFGDFAAARAASADDDDRDLRPGYMRHEGAMASGVGDEEAPPREDEEHLGKIGRGRDPIDELAH
jgi:uncharacterized protein (UPF0335 family)